MNSRVKNTFELMAPEMEAVTKSLHPSLHYHLIADAIYWSDEIPEGLEVFAESCLRIILRYRTSLIVNSPEVKWEPYWREALVQFPQWIGFAPSRSTANISLAEQYFRMKLDSDI